MPEVQMAWACKILMIVNHCKDNWIWNPKWWCFIMKDLQCYMCCFIMGYVQQLAKHFFLDSPTLTKTARFPVFRKASRPGHARAPCMAREKKRAAKAPLTENVRRIPSDNEHETALKACETMWKTKWETWWSSCGWNCHCCRYQMAYPSWTHLPLEMKFTDWNEHKKEPIWRTVAPAPEIPGSAVNSYISYVSKKVGHAPGSLVWVSWATRSYR